MHLVGRSTRTGLPLRAGALNNALVAVKHFYRVLYEADVIAHTPARRMGLVRVPSRLPPPVLTVEEAARLLDSIDPAMPAGARDRAAYELCYASAMRAGELLALDVEDLDLEHHLCRIRHGKGGKQRAVPFGPVAAGQLDNYLRWVRPSLGRGHATRAVWLNPWGRRLAYETLRARLRTYARGAAFQESLAPCASPRLRDAPARSRRGSSPHPGAARPRLRRDHADLHAPGPAAPQGDARPLPPTRTGGECSRLHSEGLRGPDEWPSSTGC